MSSIIVGTAGHIDHGKSALVRALTGKDPDRLPEEKRRGITIDLGFADLELGDVRIGFVDVPGHERFIRNMLAGAHGIDVVALVIAADEGVMPQTREHFDICRLLGTRSGLIVITKSDLAEAELVELVREEAEELVKGSFLEGAPVVNVSAKTGAGLDELKALLKFTAAQIPKRPADLVPRLPIDRVFTMKGFGAVVTGTLVAGELQAGDELELLPVGRRTRARGLQVHGQPVGKATAGQRTAVNLGGLEVADIDRGMVLAPVGRLRATQVLDVRLEVLPDAPRALRSRARVRLHIHAAEVLGRLRVLNEAGAIEPGQTGFAQLRLESPIVAVTGEHFVLRSYSPSRTIAGGQVLEPFARKHRGRDFNQITQQLETLTKSDRAAQLSVYVSAAGIGGQKIANIAARTGWTDDVLADVLSAAVAQHGVFNCDGVLVSTEAFSSMSQRALNDIERHHQREPLSRGVARETLRERCFAHAQPEVFRAVLGQLESAGSLVADKDVVRSSVHTLEVTGADAELRERLAKIYAEAKLGPPSLDEVLQQAGVPRNQLAHGRKVLQLLIDKGEVVRIQPDLLFDRQALAKLKADLRGYGDQHEPSRSIDVATFKELAGVSRKYAIPLLEYFDRERITRRTGDQRIISK